MTRTALQNYHDRMQRVLDHVDQHLDGDLDLEAMSRVAAFSKFHFQRQFTATFGMSLLRYVQLARLKRASFRLAYRSGDSVTNIAMDAGYDAPDAFARAFRQRIGQSPSSFRQSPDWQPWLAAFGLLDTARTSIMQQEYTAADVTIRDFAPTQVAIMTHRGGPATIGTTIQRFISWRKASGLPPKTHPTFNIFHAEPEAADHRVDLCVGTTAPIDPKGEAITEGLIPGGRCAVLRVTGHTDNLAPAALFLYRDWLPASGEELRDFPLFCQRVSLFPDVPEHEAVADVFLPLK